MAFKLDKGEIARRDGYANDLRETASKLEDAVREYNEAVMTLRAPIETLLAEYNEKLEEARGFAEDIATTAEGAFDDKSEKWQEGDKGQAVAEWKDAWTSIELEPMEIVWPEDLEDPELEHAFMLEALPVEPEE
jgi:hypothetical protein